MFFFVRDSLARDFKPPALEDGFGVSGLHWFPVDGRPSRQGRASFSTSCRPAWSSPTL